VLADEAQLPLHRGQGQAEPPGGLLVGVALQLEQGHPPQVVVGQQGQQPAALLGDLGRERRARLAPQQRAQQ